jgi:RNA polymerase-binding transcription factor DksA
MVRGGWNEIGSMAEPSPMTRGTREVDDMDETTRTTAGDDRSPVDTLRAELEHAREHLDRLVAEYEANVNDPDVIQEDRDSAAQMVSEAQARVADVEAAIARAEAGDYGRCVTCGAEIPAERLEALPGTDTCVNCS